MAEQALTTRDEQVVVFELAEECYGVDIGAVQEIIRVPAITPVPRAPEYVEGVINLRGHVIPVIDLRRRFALPAASRDRNARIIVLRVAGQTVGAAVDAVTEVLRIPADVVESPGAVLGSGAAPLRGIAKVDARLIILLDLDRVFEQADFAADAA